MNSGIGCCSTALHLRVLFPMKVGQAVTRAVLHTMFFVKINLSVSEESTNSAWCLVLGNAQFSSSVGQLLTPILYILLALKSFY